MRVKEIECIEENLIKEGKMIQEEDDFHHLDVNQKDAIKDEDHMEIDVVKE